MWFVSQLCTNESAREKGESGRRTVSRYENCILIEFELSVADD